MNTRKIETILQPQNFNWVGNAFYTASFIGGTIPRSRMSPFFALGYNADIDFEATEIPRGVGAHPHKGFETVTLAYKGKIAHKDSMGNQGVIGEGDIQWMTAGSGILHQEYHDEDWSKNGGLFQMVQIWVNLPAKFKETPPKYQELKFNTINTFQLTNDDGKIQVIAGNYNGIAGSATTFSPMNMYNIYLNNNGKVDVNFDKEWNTALLVINGSLKINNSTIVEKDSFVLFENNAGTDIQIEALSQETIVLVMSGAPINEPVVHYGPFVMNTKEQIEKAIIEYQSGKFGTL